MIDRLKKLFLLPIPEDDPEMALGATIYNCVWLGVATLLSIAVIGSLFIFVRKGSAVVTTIALVVLLSVATVISRRINVKLGGALLIVGIWIAFSVHVYLAGGLNSIFSSTLIVTIPLAAVLVSRSFAIVLTGLTVGLTFCMTFVQSLGISLPHYYPMPPWSAWFLLLLPIVMIVPAINGTVKAFKTSVETAYQEIDRRERAEEALREKEQRYRAFFETSRDAVFMTSLDGQFIDFNDVALEVLGYSPEDRDDLLHVSVACVYAHPEQREAHAALVAKQGFSKEYPLDLKKKDGTIIHTLITTVVWKDAQGNVLGFQGTVRDVTDLKKAEETRESLRTQLLQAQKMEAIGTLTGGIAHDFNNLLTVMNGYTELILSERAEDDPICPDLRKVLETGLRGAQMVQRLLEFSKKAEINPRPLDLSSIVQDTINLMERTFPKMIEVETILAKDLCQVNADPGQVEQVLMNLAINAKEAMPEGGRLRIETKNVAVDEAYCARHVGAKPGPHVLIEVSDTGSGMSTETIERMFDPFFTTKGWDFKKGTGLGLSVAKGIVEQHGGWITCDSEQGKGTTFSVYFPVMEKEATSREPAPQSEAIPGTATILLVDDEEQVRDLGKRLLERAGYTVITATNGIEALELYEREKSHIGLVVLDLIMPKMGGENCLGRLLEMNPKLKVIISSGHSLNAQERIRLELRVKGFVDKPYRLEQFLEVVKGILAME